MRLTPADCAAGWPNSEKGKRMRERIQDKVEEQLDILFIIRTWNDGETDKLDQLLQKVKNTSAGSEASLCWCLLLLVEQICDLR